MKRVWSFIVSLPGLLLIGIARAWQLGPSRVMPPTCRYSPSCSQYAIEAVKKHGAIKGGSLAIWRLLRCQPWGGHGYDPVPDLKQKD
ncbi:putative membrane protein insertion efficiency factor [Novosphingobium indicum]|uniref:Putative membrane protein insertion efficiency factor n=1 Tax=Novosphingobium indicum TaxID=462949 RepID=A0ABQ2JU76_9SPHN|nr:putative membrane protein insertion efficiency factor [Novosphingobium indicum]